MWTGKRIRIAVSLICLLLVFTAETAHLVHTSQSHREHAKKTSELACSLCAFSLKTAALTAFAPPALVLLAMRQSQEPAEFSTDGSLPRVGTRAPPVRV